MNLMDGIEKEIIKAERILYVLVNTIPSEEKDIIRVEKLIERAKYKMQKNNMGRMLEVYRLLQELE